MSKKKKSEKANSQKVQKILDDQKTSKSNVLILAGVILSMSSIGLLIFVLSEKVFHLS